MAASDKQKLVKLQTPKGKPSAKTAEESETDVSPETNTSGGEGVKVTEDLQRQVYELLNGATEAECEYVSSCCSERRSELYDEKQADKAKPASDEEVNLSPD